MTSTAILIPARYGSTRFPGKPLADLGGVTMIQRVYDSCRNAGFDTYVLTDDMRVSNLFPNDSVYYDTYEYANGTERCAGAIRANQFSKYDTFVNVQGDMPDVTTDVINATVSSLWEGADVATVYTDMDPVLQQEPGTVKMIKCINNAQWFGRGFKYGYHHLGVYGYTREALQCYAALKVTQEEKIEQLEQLRWLKNGWQIRVNHVYFKGIEINTPEDLKKWQQTNSQ
jgi:3-deoxy-manno-octulosonate cytidylyltransferase (CMP-KDO synthetase)